MPFVENRVLQTLAQCIPPHVSLITSLSILLGIDVVVEMVQKVEKPNICHKYAKNQDISYVDPNVELG